VKIVLDTNVLLVSISPRSKNHWLWEALLAGDFELCVTTDILDEYAEIIGREMGQTIADMALDLLSELPNVTFIQKYYWWNLIEADPDDNKFVDCAIAASARYIVSEDKHFKALQNYPFFKVEWMVLADFKALWA
jgi:uncharacterized protein